MKTGRGRSGGGFQEKSVGWSCSPEIPTLPENAVHIWWGSLTFSPEQIFTFRQMLSQSEVERADRYRFEVDRDRFVARYGILRTLLGRYLNTQPGQVQLTAGSYGKPQLASESACLPVEFNMSSSNSMALFGICLRLPLGVDIERIDDGFDFQDIVSSYFSEADQEKLQSTPVVVRRNAFFRFWVRHEAYLKGLGQGFSHSAQFLFQPLFEPAAEKTEESAPIPISLDDWFIHDLQTPSGYMGALAIRGKANLIYGGAIEFNAG